MAGDPSATKSCASCNALGQSQPLPKRPWTLSKSDGETFGGLSSCEHVKQSDDQTVVSFGLMTTPRCCWTTRGRCWERGLVVLWAQIWDWRGGVKLSVLLQKWVPSCPSLTEHFQVTTLPGCIINVMLMPTYISWDLIFSSYLTSWNVKLKSPNSIV